jgi:hypothetical protein
MTLQTDYRLITLYNSSLTDFETYLSGFLIQGVDDFSYVCDQDLSYTLSTKLFTQTLTQKNLNILAKFMKKYWLEKMITDVSQMNLRIQDRDYKNFAESMNYKEKREGYILELEKLSQILIEYGYRDTSNWDVLNAINS